ncbi:quaternary ammonium compound-resistance protein SugE [Cellulosimicrobium cellulans]|jgi:quaternary ammonium compound-resistance protein SugE|uniref:QacE family quaternary ammonium compound efflux SMR transporter n=1 Tax=Cellulosimicrobium cellulans TaxID=1710 RepID=A0A1Y0HY67_CELCE|nr:multidrug efflux SMR transporter [Cellulosimicrobium cellulans]ARU52245.1 QacE family quaternary ammonium compound efflux SMR transporter [Cellulosimicrobium cellulans]MBM7818845.1 quaternary ammonium compound-resistance protein SugE [Cellulosimicrobium cellulans]
MAWIVLIVSGMLEAGWALSLKASHGFTKLWPSVAFVVMLVLSMVGLSIALKSLPVGVAYGVWVGIGASLTAVLAVVLFDEPVTILKVVSLVLIVAGVVGLNLSGGGH